ncbi:MULTISPECIES: type II toxin-antitoxin system RelE/ParE family toxin [unclassified Chamaesiphon]|uniref:type II toxin-antitoxin system RelE/ParE family toxin n=1 Tax=unclassified Chamaesiphon TaxID=2620921 RepID=UPI00286CF0CB|nr:MULTISPECIES: type II toxin-antitoxin system RelE/ParE family toxin [unclassified Chamaesiphon]
MTYGRLRQRFRLTKPAIQDIEEIADYIAQQSGLEQSARFLGKLESKFSKIVTFPLIGRKRDEILTNIRTIPLDMGCATTGNFTIIYLKAVDLNRHDRLD